MGCVLIVDDEFFIVEMLTAMIEDMGIAVCGSADTACEAVRLTRMYEPILVLMDIRLKGMKDGIDAALKINAFKKPSPIIFISGSQEPETLKRVEMAGAPMLSKPFRFAQLKTMVEQVIGIH